MSRYEQRPGDVIIFKNDRKTNPKAPDYKGNGLSLEGEPIEIALWIKEGRKGKFLTGNIKPKGEGRSQGRGDSHDDDDLPF